MEAEYVPVVIPPDAARDARVAARRAADAARAARALDRLLAVDDCDGLRCSCCGRLDDVRKELGYEE